jgi:hypothetical protein
LRPQPNFTGRRPIIPLLPASVRKKFQRCG